MRVEGYGHLPDELRADTILTYSLWAIVWELLLLTDYFSKQSIFSMTQSIHVLSNYARFNFSWVAAEEILSPSRQGFSKQLTTVNNFDSIWQIFVGNRISDND